jgi:ribosomal protein L21E
MPRSNGQAERVNKTILEAMKTMGANGDEDCWDMYIISMQHAINSTYHHTIKAVPSEVMFGYRLRTDSDSLGPEPDGDSERTADVTKLRECVNENIRVSAKYQKERFDRKRTQANQYKIGDLVVIKIQSQSNDGRSKKLLPTFRGPFQIVKCLGRDRYEVKDMRGSERSKKIYNGVAAAENIKPWINIDNWNIDNDTYNNITRVGK